MLNSETKRHIDKARDVLVGVAPSPMTQVDLITTALIYKFMDDMDQQSIKLGGKPSFFIGDIEKYSWSKLMDPKLDNQGKVNLYQEALTKLPEASNLPSLFREIFKDTFLPFRNVNTFKLFIDEIDYFDYSHPEELGNAFEYLLTILGVSGDAGMFRTPRHIIDFIVKVVDPNKDDRILDPACGTAGFLIQAYKHIISKHDGLNDTEGKEKPLTTEELKNLTNNIEGYDISPEMVKLSSVNLYLHDFKNPKISEYDTLSSDEKWNERFDVILANPPFMTPRGGIIPHNRFSIQATKSEVLFVDYILSHLKHNGRAGIVVPEGIIFQSGNAYKELRKKLINEGLFGVVSLPSGVFNPYSGVKTSILLIDKELAKSKDEVLFIKISNDGFDLGAQRREINKNDLPEALEIINSWKNGEKIKSKLVSYVSKQKIFNTLDLNLTGDRYLESSIEAKSDFKILKLKELEIEYFKGISISEKGDKGKYCIVPSGSNFPEGIKWDRVKFFNSENIDKNKKLFFGDILLNTGGVGTLGRVGFFNGYNLDCFPDSFILVLRNKGDILLPKYLWFVLQSDYIKEKISNFTNGSTGITSIKTEDILSFEIPVPSIEIQEQIVEELDRYQKIIEGAKLISDKWKPNFEIDKNWSSVKLGEVCDVRDGTHESPKQTQEGYPLITSKNIKRGQLDFSNVSYISEKDFKQVSKRSYVDVGDIIMPMIGTIGGACLIKSKEIEFAIKNVALFKKSEKIVPEYLLNILGSDLVATMLNESSAGATQRFVSLGVLRGLEIPLPSLEIQKQVVEKIEKEKKLVDSSKELIEIYEKRIKEKIDSLWKRD